MDRLTRHICRVGALVFSRASLSCSPSTATWRHLHRWQENEDLWVLNLLSLVISHPGSGSGLARICAWVWCPAQDQRRAYVGMLGACSPIGTNWIKSWRVAGFPSAVLLWVVAASSGTVISSWREQTCKLGREDRQKMSKDMKISVLAQEQQPFTWKSAVLQGGNNSVSVLCSSYESVRECLPQRARLPDRCKRLVQGR